MNLKTANRLQQLRKQHGYSQEELANLLNVSRQAVSKWECAEASPDTDNLIAIAKLYDVSLDELINGNSVKPESEPKKERRPHIFEDDVELTTTQKITISIVSGCIVFVATTIFLIIGLCFNIWHPTWLVFMSIPVVTSIADAIIKRNPSHFVLPVLIAAIYMCVGFFTGLWHPCWIIFLIIPIYYIIIDGIKLAKAKKNNNNDNI